MAEATIVAEKSISHEQAEGPTFVLRFKEQLMKIIKLSDTQVQLLTEILQEEILRVSQIDIQYRGQIISSLSAIIKKIENN